MTQHLASGTRYVLGIETYSQADGTNQDYYVIWNKPSLGPTGEVIAHFPKTDLGYRQAWEYFLSIEPNYMSELSKSAIEVRVDGPVRQRRATIVFRILIVFPQALIVGILNYCLAWLAFLSWFQVLITGEITPDRWNLSVRIINYMLRVNAYSYLLTDQHPPFELYDASYPVELFVEAQRFSRWGVFFRIILAIPVLVLQECLGIGIFIILIFAWLIALVLGRLPEGIHWTLASIVRFQTRVLGYMMLVTPRYPWGLLGDPPTAKRSNQHALILGKGSKFAIVVITIFGLLVLASMTIAEINSFDRLFSTSGGVFGRLNTTVRLMKQVNVVAKANLDTLDIMEQCKADPASSQCNVGEIKSTLPILETFFNQVKSDNFDNSSDVQRRVLLRDVLTLEEDLRNIPTFNYQLVISTDASKFRTDTITFDYASAKLLDSITQF